MPAAPAPTLVFGWGNPSRGDDALGPLVVEAVSSWGLPGVECLTDFQLQVENALDLQGRSRVLFVDASAACPPPFEVTRLEPHQDTSHTTHELSPQAVLAVYAGVLGDPPPCWLLGIRGEEFDLGAAVTPAAAGHLKQALTWLREWLTDDYQSQ